MIRSKRKLIVNILENSEGTPDGSLMSSVVVAGNSQRMLAGAGRRLRNRVVRNIFAGIGVVGLLVSMAMPAFAGRAVATTTNLTPAIGAASGGSYGVVSGRAFTMTATVSPTAAFSGATFTFKVNASNVAGCTALPISSAGQATCTTSVVGANESTHDFAATYSGNAGYQTSTTSLLLKVGGSSSISYTPASPVGVGIPGQLCASVSAGNYFAPNGTVAFVVNGTTVSTVTLPAGAVTPKQACTNYTYPSANANNQVWAIYNAANSSTASVKGSTATVVSHTPTVSIASASNPGAAGAPINFLVSTNMAGSSTGTCISLLDGPTVVSANNAVAATNPTSIPLSLTGGTHNISATLNNCAATIYATSAVVAQVVNLGTTPNTTALTSSANPSVEANTVSFVANVNPSTATGTVTFKEGATILGTGTLNGGSASFATSTLAVGTHPVTAFYSGDNTYAGTFSPALDQVVSARATTTVSLGVDVPSPVVHGVQQRFTATVSPASATGTVAFMDGSTPLGTFALSGGIANFTTATLSTGTHSITAVYSGDPVFASTSSVALTNVVNISPSTVAISGGSANAYLGVCYVLKGLISNASGLVTDAGGTEEFFKGAVSLGTANVTGSDGRLSCFSPTLGANSISVKYSGDANYTLSTSPTVVITGIKNSFSGVNLVRGGGGDRFFVGDTHGIEVWVTNIAMGNSEPTDGTFTIKEGTTTIGTASPVATVVGGTTYYIARIPTTATSFTTPGSHNLTVAYTGGTKFADVTLNRAFLVTAVATGTLKTSAPPVGVNKPVTLKATLTPLTGVLSTFAQDINGIPPVFKDGSTTIPGTAVYSIASGNAEWNLTYTPTAAGNRTINVTYPKNTGANAAVAPAFNLPVMANGGSATVITAPVSSLVGSPLLITATVSGNTAATPTGTVTFKDGAAVITGCSALAMTSAVANCTTSTLIKGAHSITAVYSGDASNATSTSVVHSVAVTNASATALTSSVNPVGVAATTTLRAALTPSTATGSVNFYSGSTLLANASLASGVATAPVVFFSPATVRAVYQGDANNFTSTSSDLYQAVTELTPVITATSSSNPSGQGTGKIVFNFSNYFSNVSYKIDVNGTTVAYQYIGSPANQMGPPTDVTLQLATYSAGTYTITASVVTDGSNNGVSTTVVQQINAPVVLSVAPNPVAAGAAFVATATLTGVTPTGTVTFKDGTATLGTGTVSGSVATLSTSIAIAGTHSLTASYSGDTNNPTSASAIVSLQVGADPGLVSPGDMTALFQYDANGNLVQATDPIGHVTQTVYDKLGRKVTEILPAHAMGAVPGVVTKTLDAADNVKQILDPRSVPTTYTANGLGNVTEQTSADTGVTKFTYDAMGNPLTKTDARNMVSTMTYDDLHRLSTVSYTSGVGTTLTYDGGSSPVLTDLGHLTKITDESGSTAYGYDQLGRVISKSVIIAGKQFIVQYGYGSTGSAAGSLISITYPSGTIVNYSYGSDGKINGLSYNPVNSNGVNVNAASVNVLDGITYNALGSISGWTWEGGVTNAKMYDAFGRISTYFLGNPAGSGMASGLQRTINYDAAGKPISFVHTNASGAQLAADHMYDYDGRSRLINGAVAGTSHGYGYDLTSNRTHLIVAGNDLVQSIMATSNRVTSEQVPGPVTRSYSYDANGNVQGDGIYTYTYSARGRLSSVLTAGGTVTYLYNALEQRAFKAGPVAVVPSGGAYFIYDEGGNLLGEYDTNGAPLYEPIYLAGAPVGLLKRTGTAAGNNLAVSLSNVYADHLGTPRVVTRSGDQSIVWRWDAAEAFGGSAANQNPSGLGTFAYNQRFPGQIFDAETGNFYNHHRDYDPQTGRYAQSDPIGLSGGINTYTYAEADPIRSSDPTGLSIYIDPRLQQYVDNNNRGSAESRKIINAMTNDPNVTYALLLGNATTAPSGGSTTIQQGSPGLFDPLFGRPLPRATIMMTIDPNSKMKFTDEYGKDIDPTPERSIAHELGHGYTYLKGGFVAYKQKYHDAIDTENIICRQVNPKAQKRPVSDHGGLYDTIRTMGR